MLTGAVWKCEQNQQRNQLMSKLLTLPEIQKLQFSDKSRAEEELLQFLQKHEDRSIEKIELMPKPESLNSVNGFITYAHNERYFFKSHMEENEQLSEYYNADLLIKAGYPVINAKQISRQVGKQITLYEIVSMPTLFDLVKSEEDKETGNEASSQLSKTLLNAQIALDKTVANIYQGTYRQTPAREQMNAPVNQLFSHRLAEDGRLGLFYRQKFLRLEEHSLSFDVLANLHWTINGVYYPQTLEEIIQQSKLLLAPQLGPAIIGHGDTHNGNIFVDIEKQKLLMFDPAFAGIHHPLLDITKPLFHNVFAKWMYFPEQVAKEMQLTYKIAGDQIIIEHSFSPSALRTQFLQSKIHNVLVPTLNMMRQRSLSLDNWQHYLRAALFCCPFLTVNLFADYKENGTLAERYPISIKLLGLAIAVEMGSRNHKGSSYLSGMIDNIFAW